MLRSFEIACLCLFLVLAGCGTSGDVPDPDAWNATLGQYRQTAVNRALAMNVSPESIDVYKYYWVWGRPTPDLADHDALEACDRALPRDHTRPGACKLVATNDTFHFRREDLNINDFTPGQ
jgi:hypothetical protein